MIVPPKSINYVSFSSNELSSGSSISVSNGNSTDYDKVFYSSCSWSKYWLLYCGMWVTHTPSGKRSKWLNIVAISLILFCFVYLTSYNVYYMLLFTDTVSMFLIMSLMMISVFTITRLTALYYFVFEFEYPWKNVNSLFKTSFDLNINDHMKHRLKTINIRTKILVIIIVFIAVYLSYYFFFSNVQNEMAAIWFFERNWFTQIVLPVTMGYTEIIPLFFHQYVFAINFLKFELYLHGLTQYLFSGKRHNKKIDYDALIKEYGIVYNKLHDNSYFLGQIFWSTAFIGGFGLIWQLIAGIIEYPQYLDEYMKIYAASVIYMMILFGEYILAASHVNSECDKFNALLLDYNNDKNTIWKQLIEFDGYSNLSEKISSIHSYNCYLKYVMKYPLNIKLLGFKISGLNCIKFILFFLIAKGISYSIYYI